MFGVLLLEVNQTNLKKENNMGRPRKEKQETVEVVQDPVDVQTEEAEIV